MTRLSPAAPVGATPSRGRHQWPGKTGFTVALTCVAAIGLMKEVSV
jgi:hypothetical protein